MLGLTVAKSPDEPSELDLRPAIGYFCNCMAFRVGIFDIIVAVLVLVVILLPARDLQVRAAHRNTEATTSHDIGMYEARLIRNPGDGEAAQKLSELLLKLGHSDWAMRVAGSAAQHAASPTVWRSYLAVSWAHVERFEIEKAHEWAARAMQACERSPAACPGHEKARLMIYESELKAGLRSGIDPRTDPRGFRRAIRAGTPVIKVRLGRDPAPAKAPDRAPASPELPQGNEAKGVD